MIFSFGNKCLELWGPRFWSFASQVYILDIGFWIRYRGDHSPAFYCLPCVLNLQLFEIHWYDVRHEDDDPTPEEKEADLL